MQNLNSNFTVKSYLCNPNIQITDLSELKENPSYFLININDKNAIKKIKNIIDPDYINGVIYIQYGDQIIFDYTLWDLIDQLWSYIVTAVREYKDKGFSSVYFPDQPIQFEMKRDIGNNLIFRLQTNHKQEWILPEKEFLNILLEQAAHFFTELRELSLIDDTTYNYEIDRIRKLSKNS